MRRILHEQESFDHDEPQEVSTEQLLHSHLPDHKPVALNTHQLGLMAESPKKTKSTQKSFKKISSLHQPVGSLDSEDFEKIK